MERHVLVVDVETTCWERGGPARREWEIIEIGAVLLGPEADVKEEFQTFVQPVRHPLLSAFCSRLTGIAQEDVRAAPGFAVAYAAFVARMTPGQPLLCTWGDNDRRQFRRDCAFHQVADVLDDHFLNLKADFAARTGLRPGLPQALAHCGLAFQGRHHRALDDARNAARLLPFLRDGRSNRR